ncbi:MAG: arsenate reductase ArsC [bacterium]
MILNNTKPKILFVCVENSCRSQMAEGFAEKYRGDEIEVFSAGSYPSGRVNPDAIKVMGEIGIDISKHRSKGFNDLPYKMFDYVVTMGCGDVCPFIPSKQNIDWQIPDPTGIGMDHFRKVRDEIGEKVKELLSKI